MPADFEACVKAGGKVRTQSLSRNRYRRVCKTKAGNWTRGHIKTAKTKGKSASYRK